MLSNLLAAVPCRYELTPHGTGLPAVATDLSEELALEPVAPAIKIRTVSFVPLSAEAGAADARPEARRESRRVRTVRRESCETQRPFVKACTSVVARPSHDGIARRRPIPTGNG